MTSTAQGTIMSDNANPNHAVQVDDVSDYGDFDIDAEESRILDELLASVERGDSDAGPAATLVVTDIEDYEPASGIILPKTTLTTHLLSSQNRPELEITRDLEAPNSDSRRSESPDNGQKQLAQIEPNETPDTRSPLERFRKPPKKALSVTDLVSPAWCELQYFYTLTKHGRKRRTPAMRQGSAIHKTLEEEVHTTVPIETVKKEDGLGLRFWNICQGLRTLRSTGLTRELEVWGTISGELVNGIIDELSYECPDPKHQESIKAHGVNASDLPEYQTSITEFLMNKPNEREPAANVTTTQSEKSIYLTDIKTRATSTLPTGSSLRPTIVQLHLYHHMLENLVQGNLNLQKLTERYGLDAEETFSDAFLAQLGNLNQDFASQGSGDTELLPSSQDSMDVLLQHNNLSKLWQFMMEEFRDTFLREETTKSSSITKDENPVASQQSVSDLPPPPSQPTRLSPLLTATYMLASPRRSKDSDGPPTRRVLGRKSFEFNPAFLHSYLSETLPWWQGEREAKGVTLQEAWKCRSCDFKNDCIWIHDRDKQAFDEAMERKKLREMAGLEKDKVAGKSPSRSHV